MTNLAAKVSGLVETVLLPLVEYKEELDIVVVADESDLISIEIACNEADTGKIIGRQGRVIKAVRTIARAVVPSGSRMRVDVELID